MSNKKNSKKNISLLIKELSKLDVKKFNALNLYFINNFYKKNKFPECKPKNFLNNSKLLIVGPGESVNREKSKIKKIINKEKLVVFYTNTVKNILGIKKFYRIACHPHRLITDFIFHKKSNDVLILPTTNLPKKIFLDLKKYRKKLFNFGLKIMKKEEIKVRPTKCILPKPLIIAYSISVALSGNTKKIYLAGFDGYRKDDPFNDETQEIFDIFKKKLKSNMLFSLTKTNYKIN